jgi:hypothetical protein
VADESESYECEQCAAPVGSDRVLVLTAAGQVARHMSCHDKTTSSTSP